MSLSPQDLLSIQTMPNPDELSLQTIAVFYEEHICNRQYYYELKNKQQELRLRFKQGDLCHLLGLQHIIIGSENVGELGFKKLKTGANTFVSLKQANLGGYEDMLYRMLYFPFVYQLIHNPKVVINDPHDQSLVKAQFSFYNNYTEHFVELKLRRENKDNPDFFVPVSFSEARKVKGRKHIDIKCVKVLDYTMDIKSNIFKFRVALFGSSFLTYKYNFS